MAGKSFLKPLVYRLLPQLKKAVLRRRVIDLNSPTQKTRNIEMLLLEALAEDAQSFFDIGANQGLYSAVLEKCIGKKNLYIFEPLPSLNRQLRRQYPASHVFSFALSNQKEDKIIRVPYIKNDRYDTRATLETTVSEENQTGFDEIHVSTITLDELAAEQNFPSMDLVKIDVEGHEIKAIEGAAQSLSRYKPMLLVEIEQRHHPVSMNKIFAQLETLGFNGFFLDVDQLAVKSIRDFDAAHHQNVQAASEGAAYINNFFFIPTSKVDHFLNKASAFELKVKAQVHA